MGSCLFVHFLSDRLLFERLFRLLVSFFFWSFSISWRGLFLGRFFNGLWLRRFLRLLFLVFFLTFIRVGVLFF